MKILFKNWLNLMLIFTVCSGCSRVSMVTVSGSAMGTTYQVKVATDQSLDKKALEIELESELTWINRIMSTWRHDSNLSVFNRSPIGQPMPVPDELIRVLQLSNLIHQISDGAFDISMGPLVNLWGFGPDAVSNGIPTEARINEALLKTGINHLHIQNGKLTRKIELQIDLSGIAKGFAVDRISQLLSRKGLENHLVEIGGELKARGVNDRGIHWVIAIEKPAGLERSIFRTLPLDDLAMATSGEYRHYREVDGKRYSHTIDPRTGKPVTHHLASVTVIHESAAMADGFATAINVLGPDDGMSLAIKQKLSVLFIIKSVNGFVEKRSPSMDAYLKELQAW